MHWWHGGTNNEYVECGVYHVLSTCKVHNGIRNKYLSISVFAILSPFVLTYTSYRAVNTLLLGCKKTVS
jgi:hypothetical protein